MIEMAPIGELLPKVRTELQQVPTVVYNENIIDIVNELCNRFKLITMFLPNIERGNEWDSEYFLELMHNGASLQSSNTNAQGARIPLNDNLKVLDILSLSDERGRDLTQLRKADLSRLELLDDGSNYRGEIAFFRTSVNSFRLFTGNYQGTTLNNIFVSLGVRRTAKYIPAVFFDRYKEVVSEGVLWKLYSIPGKIFSNAQRAMELERRYNRRLAGVAKNAWDERISRNTIMRQDHVRRLGFP